MTTVSQRPRQPVRATEDQLLELLAGLAAISEEIDRLRTELRAGFAEILAAIQTLGDPT